MLEMFEIANFVYVQSRMSDNEKNRLYEIVKYNVFVNCSSKQALGMMVKAFFYENGRSIVGTYFMVEFESNLNFAENSIEIIKDHDGFGESTF